MAVSSLIVGISDCKVTRDADSVLVTYALGSCIAVAMHDPVTKVSGLLHYMLPESAIDAKKAALNPFMFADTGIPGPDGRAAGRRRRRQTDGRAADGGRAGAGQPGSISNRQAQLPGGAADSVEGWDSDRERSGGGEVSRTTRLEVGTGRLWVREGGGMERELVRNTRGGQKDGTAMNDRGTMRTATQPGSNRWLIPS